MENDFFTWVTQETEKRGWTDSELSRQAGLSPSALSLVLSGQRQVSLSFCKGIAKAFGEPPEKILRLAGLLPPEPDPAQGEDDLLAVYRQLTPQQRQYMLDSARGLQGQPKPATPTPPIVTIIRDKNEPYAATPVEEDTFLPGPEAIRDLIMQLDETDQYFVVDYIMWRLQERSRRRNSGGGAWWIKRTEEERQQEHQKALETIDLLLAVNEAPAEAIAEVIGRLHKMWLEKTAATARQVDQAEIGAGPATTE